MLEGSASKIELVIYLKLKKIKKIKNPRFSK